MVMYPDKKFWFNNAFPVKDKLLPATEYIFQIVKSKKYYFNLEDVKTEIKNSTIERARRPISSTYTNDIEGNPYINHNGIQNANKKWAIMDLNGDKHQKINTREDKNVGNMERPQKVDVEEANPTNAVMFRKINQNSKRLPQQHFASYPLTLADFFIDIGCPENGIV